jgi:hypothetical protein
MRKSVLLAQQKAERLENLREKYKKDRLRHHLIDIRE